MTSKPAVSPSETDLPVSPTETDVTVENVTLESLASEVAYLRLEIARVLMSDALTRFPPPDLSESDNG